MFKYRAISFPILIALLAVMIVWPFWGKYLFAVVAGTAFGMMLYEAGKMLEKIGVESYIRLTADFGGLALLLLLLFQAALKDRLSGAPPVFGLALMGCILILAYQGWALLLAPGDREKKIRKMLNSAGLLLMCGFPVLVLSQIYVVRDLGPIALFYMMMVTKSMDTGGYIFGMLSAKLLPGGNHKIVPSISPKKSWEGTIGGILFTVGVSLLFYWLFQATDHAADALLWLNPDFQRHGYMAIGIDAPMVWYVVAGVVLALGSFAGDLTESAFKRVCGVKDSGHWIPGMGGAFDVLDSFIYNGALFWLLYFLVI